LMTGPPNKLLYAGPGKTFRPLKRQLFARGLRSVRLPVKFPLSCVEEPKRGMSAWPNTSSFRRKQETSLLQAASC